MKALKRISTFLLLAAAASCLDPYVPNLKDYNSLLVVDGMITNENISNKINLYHTTTQESVVPERVVDAIVYITDDTGIKTDLQNCGNGCYSTDSVSFTGVPGRKYILNIQCDGKEYKSDECMMLPVADVDKIYYEKAEELSGNPAELFTGLKILLNSSEAAGMDQYFRWTFEETWKFNIPFPQQYIYGGYSDTIFNFVNVPVISNICWKEHKSGDIITNSVNSGTSVNKQEIEFIAPEKSDRLTNQYSILVKQYSVSKNEFEFWNNLKKSGNAGGDIFASQPYTVISNIHNVNNPDEMVLGYFEVSAVSQKRIYITTHELEPLDLPDFKTDCRILAKSPDDWPPPQHPWDDSLQPSWQEIYTMYTEKGEYDFIGPEVKPGVLVSGRVFQSNLTKFVFAPRICVECELSGFTKRPDYWIDME